MPFCENIMLFFHAGSNFYSSFFFVWLQPKNRKFTVDHVKIFGKVFPVFLSWVVVFRFINPSSVPLTQIFQPGRKVRFPGSSNNVFSFSFRFFCVCSLYRSIALLFFTYTYTCFSAYPFDCQSVCLLIWLSILMIASLPISLYICLSACLVVCWTRMSVNSFICLSVHISLVHLLVYFHRFVFQFIHFHFYVFVFCLYF